jgi:hypothetical protein
MGKPLNLKQLLVVKRGRLNVYSKFSLRCIFSKKFKIKQKSVGRYGVDHHLKCSEEYRQSLYSFESVQ